MPSRTQQYRPICLRFILLEALQQLLKLRIGVVWVLDLMSDSPLIAVDLPVISALVSLVTKEVDLVVDNTREALLCLNVT